MKAENSFGRKLEVLERLNHSDLELCTNWGVSAPEPGSKDKFHVGLVVRPELVDTPVTIIIKKGVHASDAVKALDYVAEIIADTDKAVVKHSASRRTEGLGYFFWLGIHGKAFLTGMFRLPEHFLTWLIDRVTNRSIKKQGDKR